MVEFVIPPGDANVLVLVRELLVLGSEYKLGMLGLLDWWSCIYDSGLRVDVRTRPLKGL